MIPEKQITPDGNGGNGIEKEIIRLIYTQLPINILAVLINAGIIVFVLRNAVSGTTLTWWFGANVVAIIPRLGLFFTYKKQRRTGNVRESLMFGLFVFSTFFAGLAFGSAGVFLFPSDSFAHQVFVYFVLGGMTAGSAGTYAIKKSLFLVYSIPVLIPGTLHFLVKGGEINLAMGGMGILFYAIMVVTVMRMHKTTINSLTLSFENRRLVNTLQREKKQSEKLNVELREMSLKDPMTGLQNRRFFLEIIKPEALSFSTELAYASAKKEQRNLSIGNLYGIFLIDIDFFKRINDTYGHDSGDMVLKQFSDILTDAARAEDLIIRWGGEEFLVILRRAEADLLFTFAERVRQTVSRARFKIDGGKSISKTCSVGFTSYPFNLTQPGALEVEQSITLADRALYYAKNQGRNLSAGVFPRKGVDLNEDTVNNILDQFLDAAADDLVKLETWGR